MADPVSMMAIGGMAASAGGGVLSAIGIGQESSAKASMYQYQSALAGVNEQFAKENADYARAAGEVEAQKSGMKEAFQVGTMRAGQASRGIDIDRGSAVDTVSSQQEVGSFDQALIRSDAARKAYGFEVEAVKSTLEGKMYSSAASQTEEAGKWKMAGSLIGTAGSVASKWGSYGTNFGGGGGGGGGYSEDNKYGE